MRILIVEDYTPLRTSLIQGLSEAGFAVDGAAEGKTGLRYAKINAYDVIILDLMLPGIDGLTLLKQLRQSGRGVHVLVLTAKDTVDDRVKGLNLGADDYLIKPFVFEELLARVKALVRRGYSSKSAVIRIADLEIDTSSRVVRRDGQAIELSAP